MSAAGRLRAHGSECLPDQLIANAAGFGDDLLPQRFVE
jgi:hypothetical protein